MFNRKREKQEERNSLTHVKPGDIVQNVTCHVQNVIVQNCKDNYDYLKKRNFVKCQSAVGTEMIRYPDLL